MPNWYKYTKRAITPNDLYNIYALYGLSPETLSYNRELFRETARTINRIRSDYLQILFEEIADELMQAVNNTFASLHIGILTHDKYGKYPYDLFKEWLQDEYGISVDKLPKNRYKILTDKFYSMLARDVGIGEKQKLEIKNVANKIRHGDISPQTISRAIHIFSTLPWQANYGGPPWANITKWAYELYKAPPVDLGLIDVDPQRAKEQFDNLLAVVDVINSLHHNTGWVLSRLPKQQTTWIENALEMIKHSPDPLVLAYLANNPSLVKELRREHATKPDKIPANLLDAILHMMQNVKNPMRELPIQELVPHLLKFPVDLSQLLMEERVVASKYAPLIIEHMISHLGRERTKQIIEQLPSHIKFSLNIHPQADKIKQLLGLNTED